MGLAASQARFLQLTSRRTNIEYQGQQINQQRLALANSSSGLFEKMLSLPTAVPPSSQDDKYYTQGYTFLDERDGIQKKIYWQTYDEAVAGGSPSAASYYAPATGLSVKSAVDGTTQSFAASVIANPTSVQKNEIIEALGGTVATSPTAPSASVNFAGYDEAHTITTAADFISKITADMAGDFIVANDLDFNDLGGLSEAAITNTFSGSLDGNGNTISNLNINSLNGYRVGLFERIGGGGSVSNLSMTNTNILLGDSALSVGALAGVVMDGSIDNCSATSTIISVGDNSSLIGGLVGAFFGSVSNSSSEAMITGGDKCHSVGGLAGALSSWGASIIQNSSSSGTIILGDEAQAVGGLSGTLSSDAQNSYTNTMLVLGSNAGFDSSAPANPIRWGVGGFAGKVSLGAEISNSYSASAITTTGGEQHTGGFVGYLDDGTIDNTSFYNLNTVTFPAVGTADSGTTSNITALNNSDIASKVFPISSLNSTIWDITGSYPALNATSFTPQVSTTTSPVITQSSDSVDNRQQIRYFTIESPVYNSDGTYTEHKEQGIALLEFDNLNRLLKVTSLTDKSYIDATSGAPTSDKPLVIGDGDALTYSGQFDSVAYQNDMNKYEFEKAAYDYQIERINQQLKGIQSQDKSLELKMKQLDTEHNAVQTEMDAVQKVVQKNTESTFKTFA